APFDWVLGSNLDPIWQSCLQWGFAYQSWRILSVIKSKEEANGEMQHVALAKESLKRVEDELTSKCNEILLTIDDYLLPSSKTGEAAVFYHKM
ncbi:14-3-3 protein 7, partial [Tanacetum coccineum]